MEMNQLRRIIRSAEKRDLQALLDIYNYEVECGVATFDLHPKEMTEWEEWFAHHSVENHPLLVMEENGEVIAYASLSPYREKEAYISTVELSIYVAPAHRGKGVASALMEEILRLAREDKLTHTVVSVITSVTLPVHICMKSSALSMAVLSARWGGKWGGFWISTITT